MDRLLPGRLLVLPGEQVLAAAAVHRCGDHPGRHHALRHAALHQPVLEADLVQLMVAAARPLQLHRHEAQSIAGGATAGAAGHGHRLDFRCRYLRVVHPGGGTGRHRRDVAGETTLGLGLQWQYEQRDPMPSPHIPLPGPCPWPHSHPHTTNCSLRIRSSRLCSGSNNSVTVRSVDSRITTSTTSRVSCESAVTLTGRL